MFIMTVILLISVRIGKSVSNLTFDHIVDILTILDVQNKKNAVIDLWFVVELACVTITFVYDQIFICYSCQADYVVLLLLQMC